jgi:hypothetical protein
MNRGIPVTHDAHSQRTLIAELHLEAAFDLAQLGFGRAGDRDPRKPAAASATGPSRTVETREAGLAP